VFKKTVLNCLNMLNVPPHKRGKATERKRNLDMVEALGTYVQEGKLEKLKGKIISDPALPEPNKKQRTALPDELKDVPVDPGTINSLGDTAYAVANKLYSARLKGTGDTLLADEYDRMQERDELKRVEKRARKRRPLVTSQRQARAPAARDEPFLAHRPRRVPVPTPADNEGRIGILSGLPVKTLEDQECGKDQMQLFNLSVSRAGRATSDIILNIPPTVKVLQYCRVYQTKECLWFYSINTLMADSETCMDYPDVPVFTREYLETFMREVDPKELYERPCLNLDRDPRPGEGKIRCAAHRLSEKALGPGNGFRLRELIFKDQMQQINAAIDQNTAVRRRAQKLRIPVEEAGGLVNPRDWLDPVQELCVMCQVYFSNKDYAKLKDKEVERERMKNNKDTSLQNAAIPEVSQFDTEIVIINKFMVVPNAVGEYPLNRTLSGDKNPLGIWGPFPIWSDRNYVPVMISGTGLRGFKETNNLVFQLPQRSPQIGFSLRMPSSRSIPTHSTPQASDSPP